MVGFVVLNVLVNFRCIIPESCCILRVTLSCPRHYRIIIYLCMGIPTLGHGRRAKKARLGCGVLGSSVGWVAESIAVLLVKVQLEFGKSVVKFIECRYF